MWTELSNLSVGFALGASAYSGMSNVSVGATHRPGAEENWSLTVAGQEKPLCVVTLQTQPLNDASLHSKQSVKSQETKGRGEKRQRRNHTHILGTRRNLPCIHPPTVTTDKEQEQLHRSCPIPARVTTSTSRGQGCHSAREPALFWAGTCAASLRNPAGKPWAASRCFSRLHSTATTEGGKGIHLPGDPELLSNRHQDNSSHGKQGFGFVRSCCAHPRKAGLALRSPNKPSIPQQLC